MGKGAATPRHTAHLAVAVAVAVAATLIYRPYPLCNACPASRSQT